VAELPAGTVTFLFTDMEGSTRLLSSLGRERYGEVLAEHHRLLRDAFAAHGGIEVDTQGDAFFVAFRTAADAVAAAAAGQRALAEHEWPTDVQVRVRMGLHSGEALLEQARYVGVAVHRAQRVSSAAHGGQVLLSNSTRELVADELPPGIGLRDLGFQQLKDLDRPEHVFQLEAEGLQQAFPPIRGSAPRPTGWRRAVPRSRRGWLAAGVAVALAVAAAVAAIVLSGGDDPGMAATGDALVAIDPGSGKTTKRVDVGATPSVVSVGEGGVWAISADERTISYVDPSSGDRTSFALGSTPTDLAAGAGALWVGVGSTIPSAQAVGPIMTGLVQVDPGSRTDRGEATLPRRGGAISNRTDQRVAISDDAVWTVNPDYSISRINPQTGRPDKTISNFQAVAIAAADDEVWALGGENEVARIDPKRAAVVKRVPLRATTLDALAVGEGAVWVTSGGEGTLWRVDFAGGQPSAVPVGEGAAGVAVGEGSVWVANPLRGTVVEVDPEANAVERTIEVGGVPRAIAVGDGAVWVAATGTGGAVSAHTAGGGLPRKICGDVLFGGEGSPDVLVASDLPLQGGLAPSTIPMSQAIAYILRSRGFKAGPYKVGYQSCDDSIARTGSFDPDKCAANGRTYAANEKVVGVIGPFNSFCAVNLIPELNKAPGGGLALVGPTTSLIGLTRYGPGVPPGVLADTYPTGRRNFFRLFPPSDYEGAALAQLARDLGARDVAVVHDEDDTFTAELVESFATAAGRLGLHTTATAEWDQRAHSYDVLARTVRATRPDAVVLLGLLDANGGQVARELHSVLGPDVHMLASSGFTGIPTLFDTAGTETARSMYISLPGLVTQHLTAKARRFVRDFGAGQRGTPVEPYSVYAAQAADVLLDAIARSDGTRAGVLAELAKTRVKNGLLGDFTFDRNGDTTLNQVTILRPQNGGGRTTVASFSGAAIDRVLVPRPRLVGG
jgi:branched-chain amino acid transport system substrate-binding protein